MKMEGFMQVSFEERGRLLELVVNAADVHIKPEDAAHWLRNFVQSLLEEIRKREVEET